jgi:hypothetical protein
MTHFGLGIWSYRRRTTGAILTETRPATIIRSACLGDARMTSMPKRDKSNRAANVLIISMAQQASPNPRGQMEFFRAQPVTASTVVSRMPPLSCPSNPTPARLS